jgi:hypothetical protein
MTGIAPQPSATRFSPSWEGRDADRAAAGAVAAVSVVAGSYAADGSCFLHA